MKIQTSLRLYDIMLIKAHREDLKKPNNSNLSWLQEINRRAKTLINELGREMRERCTGVDYFFNGYPLSNFSCRKLKNCSKDLINEENALASGVFGKFDLVMIPKIPHAYWTSAFRVKALEIFHDLMNIPAHRVRLEIIRGESDIRLVSKKCLMLLSFIKLETFRDEKDPSNALKNIINKVSNCNFSQKYRTELLLTFSTSYPFVIKAEFDNFDQFTNYLHEINKVNYVTETNSMVLYQNNYNDLKNPNPLSVAVLMKIKKNTENIIVKQVTDSINRLNFVEDQKIEPLHRAFYWDLNFHFDTRDIASLIEFTTNGVAQNNNIINSVTLPFWKCDYQIPKFKRANQDIVRGKNQFKNYNKRKRELSAFIKRFRKTMPRPDLTAPLILGDDIVARRIYEIKFESEWIITQSEHLFTAWERIFDEYPYSFYSIRTEYLMYLRNVKKALDYLNSANLTDKIIRTIKSSSNKRIYENIQNILENKYKLLIDNLWEKVRIYENYLRIFSKRFPILVEKFNELLEGNQIVSEVDPHIRFCERAGLSDMYLAAINRLFLDYCGKPNNKVLESKWNGLVVNSSARDYSIEYKTQILQVPLDIRMNVQSKLLLLSHEAAHFILGNLSENTRNSFFDSFWLRLHNKAIEIIDDLQTDMLNTNMIKNSRSIEERIIEIMDSIRKRIQNFTTNLEEKGTNRYVNSEVLCDVISYLSAGPGFAKSLVAIGFMPTGQHKPFSDYPSIWLRVKIGCLISNALGWANVWKSEMRKIELEINKYAEILNVTNSFIMDESEVDFAKIAASLYFQIEQPRDSSFFDYKMYIIKALFSEESYLLVELIKWLKNNFGTLLFFPEPWGKEESRKIYRKCKRIANKLHSGEIILEGYQLKHIAAASLFPPLKRPMYPTGRIIHSLYYCNPKTSLL